MKKILMLVMMVVTMGLVGCGEMTAEEMEKEIVSIAEENGYEMIIIKKNDTEVESSTYSVKEEVEEIPEPTRITTPTPVPTDKVTPTPFPTPTNVPVEESEDVNVVETMINPSTGEKMLVTQVYGTITLIQKTEEINPVPYIEAVICNPETGYKYPVPNLTITEEQYNTLQVGGMVLLTIEANANGEPKWPFNGLLDGVEMYPLDCEFVTE